MKEPSFVGARFFMGSVTNIANRPFRRLVTDYGADATIGEMAIAKYVVNGGKQDLTLIKRGPHDRIFGAQIVGGNPNHLAKAARLAEKYGADFVDFNCACPHQSVVSHGGGAILLRRPEALVTQLDAIRQAVNIPVSIKIRKGFDEDDNVAQEVADIAQKAGFNAIFIHGRTKAAQYRGSCDWELIESVAQNADVPVIGCGDLATGSDVLKKLPETHCAGFALARGAIMKPWIFKEIKEGHDIEFSAEERLEMLRTLVNYTLETFGKDEIGLKKSTDFLCKQLDFLTRYAPPSILGYELPMQERAPDWTPRSELEALWKRTDRAGMLELLACAGLPDTPEPRVREERRRPETSAQDEGEVAETSESSQT